MRQRKKQKKYRKHKSTYKNVQNATLRERKKEISTQLDHNKK